MLLNNKYYDFYIKLHFSQKQQSFFGMSVEIDNIYLPTNPDVNRDKKKEKG